MAVPEQIKEITVTTVEDISHTSAIIGLAADPDRIFLRIHNRTSNIFFYTISSTAPSDKPDMVKVLAADHKVEFNTHVPTEAIYVQANASSTGTHVTIEHATRNSTT